MTLKEYYNLGKDILSKHYGSREAEALCLRLLEDKYKIKREDIILNSGIALETEYFNDLEKISTGIPIQHITGFQEFMGINFIVTENTLIPRPETEELVSAILSHHQNRDKTLSILDIGTGSGSIAISLKLLFHPQCNVSAIDISKEALKVAEKNAENNGAEINFSYCNILTSKPEGKWDIIVSNPPYIPESERTNIPKNVLNHDPDIALFVGDLQPLIFYTEISRYAYRHLNNNGMLYFEINENYGKETIEEVKKAGFSEIELIKDMFEKDRFIWCRK